MQMVRLYIFFHSPPNSHQMQISQAHLESGVYWKECGPLGRKGSLIAYPLFSTTGIASNEVVRAPQPLHVKGPQYWIKNVFTSVLNIQYDYIDYLCHPIALGLPDRLSPPLLRTFSCFVSHKNLLHLKLLHLYAWIYLYIELSKYMHVCMIH